MKLPIADLLAIHRSCRLPADGHADHAAKPLAVCAHGVTRSDFSIENRKSKITTGSAFTLLEVMFAMVAFCTAIFVILALVANSLAGARLLQRPMVDPGVLAAWLSQTNLVEGTYTKNLGDLLGDAYDNYECTYHIQEVRTNKLFQVDFVVKNDQAEAGQNPVVSKMNIQLFSPNSPAGSLDGGMGGP